jgi:hypothetical protein
VGRLLDLRQGYEIGHSTAFYFQPDSAIIRVATRP